WPDGMTADAFSNSGFPSMENDRFWIFSMGQTGALLPAFVNDMKRHIAKKDQQQEPSDQSLPNKATCHKGQNKINKNTRALWQNRCFWIDDENIKAAPVI
mgnify:CR=1